MCCGYVTFVTVCRPSGQPILAGPAIQPINGACWTAYRNTPAGRSLSIWPIVQPISRANAGRTAYRNVEEKSTMFCYQLGN